MNTNTLLSFRSWLPILSSDDWETELSFLINIWVINFCLESNLWWLERVIDRECNSNFEGTFVVWLLVLIMRTFGALFTRTQTYWEQKNRPLQKVRFLALDIFVSLHSTIFEIPELLKIKFRWDESIRRCWGTFWRRRVADILMYII